MHGKYDNDHRAQRQGEVTGEELHIRCDAGDYDIFPAQINWQPSANRGSGQDAFEVWSADRDRRWDKSLSARYVPDIVGYEGSRRARLWRTTANTDLRGTRALSQLTGPYRTGHCAISTRGLYLGR